MKPYEGTLVTLVFGRPIPIKTSVLNDITRYNILKTCFYKRLHHHALLEKDDKVIKD